MKTEKLEQSYREQFVTAGVYPHRAEQAAKLLTREELQLTGVWPGWVAVFPQAENEILAALEA